MTVASKTLYAAAPVRPLLARGIAGIAIGAAVAMVARVASELWLAGVAPAYGIGAVSFGGGSAFLGYITIGSVVWAVVAVPVLLTVAPERRPPRLMRRIGFGLMLASIGCLLFLSILSPQLLLFGSFDWWLGVAITLGTALAMWSPNAKSASPR